MSAELKLWIISTADRIDDFFGHPWHKVCCWLATHPWWGP